MIGSTISHYKIIEKLGEGGMGVVYKAQDTKLDRLVALKFLPPHLASDAQDKQRFILEAKAASALDHPNICNVHEIDETPGGQVFIVMAIYEGIPLNRKIERGPVKIDAALDVVIQVAEGLQAAHEKGIVHRDIKSSNIMMTDKGRAVIMDFGLAQTDAAPKLTKTGSTLGTVPYMSPEQARGQKVDHRSDIWSLGVVLYEMVAGRLPFQSAYSEAIVYSILNEEPPPLTSIRSDVPMELERIAKKTMQKQRDERYQRVEDMLVDVRSLRKENESRVQETRAPKMSIRKKRLAYILGSLAVVIIISAVFGVFLFSPKVSKQEHNSIAVLPFQNLGAGQDLDFLRLSLADEISTSLSYTPNLHVRPSASSRKYAESSIDPQAAGHELGVATVVTGLFTKESDRLRVNLQLIDVESNRVMWGETFRTLAQDWVGMEAQIQKRVRERMIPLLGLTITSTEAGIRPRNSEAYELYLRSVVYPNSNNKQPITMLERAVLLDSSYASAWAALGRRYYFRATFEDGGDDFYRLAERAYQRAVALDPNLVEATRGLISSTVEGGQLTKAYDMAQELVRRRPNNALAHHSLSYVLRFAGLFSEATRECETAFALDPHEPALRSCGFALMMAGDYERALSYWRNGPESEWSNNAITFILLRQEKYEEALQITAKLIHNPTWPARFVDAFLRNRPASEVKRLADEYVRKTLRLRRDPESAYLDAALLSFCKQRGSALELLQLAVAGNFCMAEVLDTDPLLENIRSTSEFRTIRAIGMECQNRFLAHRSR